MRRRAIAKLPESIEQILKSYAMAAGAAGVSLLALAQPSEAKIIYNSQHVKLAQNEPFYLRLHHLNHSIRDFGLLLATYGHRPSSYLSIASFVENGGTNAVWATNRLLSAAALHGGIPVGPKGHFDHDFFGNHGMAWWGYTSTGFLSFGPWRNVKDRYLGLKFFVDGQPHYGWARLTVHIYRNPPELTAVLTGYAYETIPNKPITTGDTGTSQDASLIEPPGDDLTVPFVDRASLGVLAAGALGLAVWRPAKVTILSGLRPTKSAPAGKGLSCPNSETAQMILNP
jgi:hypothetical protein